MLIAHRSAHSFSPQTRSYPFAKIENFEKNSEKQSSSLKQTDVD